jgi:hypothetical protein
LGASYTLTFPADDGTSGQALITDGSGVLSWSTAASGDVYGPASATDNALARFDGTTGKLIKDSSGLIYDGINLGVGTASPTYKLNVVASAGSQNIFQAGQSGVSNGYTISSDGTNLTYQWYPTGSEGMRLTSTGLGIGTSSISGRLDIANTGSDTNVFIKSDTTRLGQIVFNDGANQGLIRYDHSTDTMSLFSGGTQNLFLNSSGNLGLGVTPSAWTVNRLALQVSSSAFWTVPGSPDLCFLSANVYDDGAFKYIGTGFASYYRQGSGAHSWHTAASGTAGNAISSTQVMTLDADGRLGIGTTSPAQKLHLNVASGSMYQQISSGSNNLYLGFDSGRTASTIQSNNALVFDVGSTYTERARITSGGYFKASNGGSYFDSAASYHELRVTANTGDWVTVISHAGATASAQYGLRIELTGDPNTTTPEMLYCSGASTLRMSVRSNGGIANYSANNVNLSDRREKTNFAPATAYLDKICAIPVQTFNYIDQNFETDDGLTLGVVAQDVQAVAPELVTESNWGTKDDPKMRLSIYQTDLQYALMKALQELKAEFDAYKASHP